MDELDKLDAVVEAFEDDKIDLNDWELGFIESLQKWSGEFTYNQGVSLNSIYDKIPKGGR